MRTMVLGAERRRGIYEMDQSESNSSRSTKHFPTFTWMFIRHQEIVPAILYFFFAYSTNCNLVRTCAVVYISAVLRASLCYKISCGTLHSPNNLFHFPPCCAEHSPYVPQVKSQFQRSAGTENTGTLHTTPAMSCNRNYYQKNNDYYFSPVFQAILMRHLNEEQNSENYV